MCLHFVFFFPDRRAVIVFDDQSFYSIYESSCLPSNLGFDEL